MERGRAEPAIGRQRGQGLARLNRQDRVETPVAGNGRYRPPEVEVKRGGVQREASAEQRVPPG